MNYLTICKKIAEIEGHYLCEEWDTCKNGVLIGKGNGDLKHYNPLTDGKLLQGLIKKYCIHSWLNFHNYWCAECITEYDYEENPIIKNPSVQKDYEYAICLAVIEANK